MEANVKFGHDTSDNWYFAKPLADLQQAKAMLVRVGGRQIALFDTVAGIRACDNRCPHEGYPLSQGSVSGKCILTCNWHNWKFDLESGENLYGGDKLRTYPVAVRGDEIWVDLTERPWAERHDAVVNSLRDAFDDHSYDRIAREIARLIRLGGDPLESLRLSIQWSWQKMEFGWTHAYAGMADWLTLYEENQGNAELQLVCLVESVAHASYDVLRERDYLYGCEVISYDEAAFIEAVELENQDLAISMIRGGLHDGLAFDDFERGLTHAALAHYNDFGHSIIYVTKARELIIQLGDEVAEPLLLSLVRGILFAAREDKIPEFSNYGSSLQAWGTHGNTLPLASNWRKKGINTALKLTVACSNAKPEIIYNELLLANAINLLSFDIEQQNKVHVTVSGNVGWLDFTHGLTFANAVRKQCTKFPELWPQGLLQMACFNGRNAAYTTTEYDLESWHSKNIDKDMQKLVAQVFDHGQGEFIVSVHLLKLALAIREEIREVHADQGKILSASLNRFFNSPLRRRQVWRTAHQSIQFVAKD